MQEGGDAVGNGIETCVIGVINTCSAGPYVGHHVLGRKRVHAARGYNCEERHYKDVMLFRTKALS